MTQQTRGRFPNYWCQITSKSHNIDIVADLPEAFALSMTGHYDGSTGTVSGAVSSIVGVVNTTAGQVASSAFTATGGDVAFQALTKRIWRGSEPIDFSLPLLFDAEENTFEDVHETCTLLSSLALPDFGGGAASIGNGLYSALDNMGRRAINAWNTMLDGNLGGVMHPPNPTRLGDYNRVDIRIGRMWLIENVTILGAELIEDVNRLGREGYPLAGGVTLRVSTELVWTKEDFYKAAGVRGNPQHSAPVSRAASGSGSRLSPLTPAQRLNQVRE